MDVGSHVNLITILSVPSSLVPKLNCLNLMKGMNSSPICDDIRLVMWRFILSGLSKLSMSAPIFSPSSATPTKRSPPSEFRNATRVLSTAFSILLSFSPVSRLVRTVDLNSTLSVSPPSISLSISSMASSSMPMMSEFSPRNLVMLVLTRP